MLHSTHKNYFSLTNFCNIDCKLLSKNIVADIKLLPKFKLQEEELDEQNKQVFFNLYL